MRTGTPGTPVTAAALAEQFYTRVGTYAVSHSCTIDVVGYAGRSSLSPAPFQPTHCPSLSPAPLQATHGPPRNPRACDTDTSWCSILTCVHPILQHRG
jgi:hypothetical protein